MDIHTKKVKGVYRRLAKWYDSTRKVWDPKFAALAEKEFNRLLAEYIKDGMEILDLGVGTGINIERILGHNISFESYKGIDLSAEMLAEAKRKFGHLENLTLCTGDIMHLEIDKEYDGIISTLVFSHLRHQEEIVQKLLAVLKPGGVLLLLFFSAKPDPSVVDKLILHIYRTVLHFDHVPIEVMKKFPSPKVEQHFPSLGGQMSIYIFQKEK